MVIRCSCTVVVRRLEASLIGGLAQVRTGDHWWIDTVYLPYLETAVSTDGKPANLALSAGLGAYLAALHYHPLWLSEGETGGIAVRKAGLRSLRECIVEAYIQGAEAAGWPQNYYLRKDVYQWTLCAHCLPLPEMAYSQLMHAFVLRLRAGPPTWQAIADCR